MPAAKQFCKDRSLSDYLNQEQGTASFPEELRKLLRNKFFEKEVAALQSCIAAGAVVRTPGVDWQRADLEVRDAILHLFSAEEGQREHAPQLPIDSCVVTWCPRLLWQRNRRKSV